MKTKNGFTLVEILVVIALISAITLIAIPSIMMISKNINTRMLESKKGLIIIAAKQYGKDNTEFFALGKDTTISVNDLLKAGYIEADADKGTDKCESTYTYGCVINPVDNSVMNSLNISIVKNDNVLIASWDN